MNIATITVLLLAVFSTAVGVILSTYSSSVGEFWKTQWGPYTPVVILIAAAAVALFLRSINVIGATVTNRWSGMQVIAGITVLGGILLGLEVARGLSWLGLIQLAY